MKNIKTQKSQTIRLDNTTTLQLLKGLHSVVRYSTDKHCYTDIGTIGE